MKAREGDIIESLDGIFFDVKGVVQPPDRVIAFIRYVPDKNGSREKYGQKYSKYYSLAKRYDLLKQQYPHYLVYDPVFNTLLCEVPVKEIRKHYKPAQGLQELRNRKELDTAEVTAVQFMSRLKEETKVDWSKMGISGSILIGLHDADSDLDFIVYGKEAGYKVQKTMQKLMNDPNSPFEAYEKKGLKELFDFRSKDTDVSFEDFVRTDSRKISHGKFMGKHFFIRFVKNHDEIAEQYGSIIYKPEGNCKIKATIVDSSQALFTPCSYMLANVQILEGPQVEPIEEIVSFRGRFCEHAINSENVIAEGKLERVIQHGKDDHFRLLLGNKPADHMVLV
jgi:predicted nucleotidyltransferase